MATREGKWWIGSRGTDPKPWTQWSYGHEPEPSFEIALKSFLTWQAQGQHVKLEWVPDGTYPTHDRPDSQ